MSASLLVAALFVGGEAGFSRTADQSYTDARNDARSGPDMVGATVRHDQAGNVTVQIETSNFPATNHVVSVYLDTDGNRLHETWIWAGRAWSEDQWGVWVHNGSTWIQRSHPSFRASGVGGKVTEYRFNPRGLGIASNRFPFILQTASVDYGSSGWQFVPWDLAPDSGVFEYELATTQPPPPPPPPPASADFAGRGSAMSPNPPRAGDVVGLGTSFRYRGTGQPVRGGAVSCKGAIGSKPIAGTPVRDSGLHACFFKLPPTSGGQIFTGRVTLTLGSRERSVQRKARIADASAMQLTAFGTRNGTGAGGPVAGQNFSAAVAVTLVRPKRTPRPIKGGNVNCPASVGGKPLGVYFKGFVQGRATCSWNIPSSARGSVFQGTILVFAGARTATKTFTSRVR